MTEEQIEHNAEEWIRDKHQIQEEVRSECVRFEYKYEFDSYIAGAKSRANELEERNKFLEGRWSEAAALIDEFLDFESSAQERGLHLSDKVRERARDFLAGFNIRHPALGKFLEENE